MNALTPHFLGLRTAIYPVKDIERAKRWYHDALGIAPYFDQPFYVGFAVGGFELGLIPDGTASALGPQPLWGVASAHAAVAHLLSLGATALDPVTEVGDGIKVAAVLDPFGNRLGVIENPHFDATAVR
jgi:catechol 2,3-dioxygenase-like lactoylglutathione lyase family enzyme